MPAVRRITRLFFGLASALLVTACGSIFAPPPSPTAPLTETATASPTATPTATATPSPTATATATPTPTPTPALIGTPFSADPQGIIELTLPRVVELARWGAGRAATWPGRRMGAWLAVATRLGVLLYDAETLEELQRLPAGEVRRVAFSPDGQRLASAGQTWTCGMWRPSSGWSLCLRRHRRRAGPALFGGRARTGAGGAQRDG